jgi:membrane protease YdiL (CAAX protease family)
MFETFKPYMKQAEKEKLLVLAPILLLLTTYLVFSCAVTLVGFKPGYLIGFLFYWIFWCLAFPIWLLGREAVISMFRKVTEPLGRPKWLGLLLLFTLPLFTLAYAFPMQLPKATVMIVVLSAAIALFNATCEEILWRGVYFKIFPGSTWWAIFTRRSGLASGITPRSLC